MTDHDVLDRELRARYAQLTAARPDIAAPPTSAIVERAARQARRGAVVRAVTAAAVLVVVAGGAVLALRGAATRDQLLTAEPPTTVTEPSSAPPASAVPTASTLVSAPSASPAWWGFDPAMLDRARLWSSVIVDGPPHDDQARFVLELRRSDEWRSAPAMAVVLSDGSLDEAATDPIKRAPVAIEIAGRPAVRRGSSEPTSYRETVVQSETGGTLAFTTVGATDDDIAAVVDALAMADGGAGFPPDGVAGWQAVSATPVTGDRSHLATMTYRMPVADERDLVSMLRIVAVDDPVLVATATIEQLAGIDGEPMDIDDVAGLRTGGGLMWRDGGALYRVQLPTPDVAGALAPTLHRLGTADVDRLVVHRASLEAWPSGQMDQPTMAVDDDIARKLAVLEATLPAGFVLWEGDPPTPIGEGVARRYRSDGADAWISLTLVHSTEGPPSTDGEDVGGPIVERDLASSTIVSWQAPSGWSYVLSVDAKDPSVAPAFDLEQMRTLLAQLDVA